MWKEYNEYCENSCLDFVGIGNRSVNSLFDFEFLDNMDISFEDVSEYVEGGIIWRLWNGHLSIP